MPDHSSHEGPLTTFGPNEWLVDELYEQYLADKNSVDPAWWDFFADYQPAENPGGSVFLHAWDDYENVTVKVTA
ncbi:2-oxoglutarate dehydrogenase E1 subunit family protein, partial [Kineococcus glutinatus]|uniref:2-oxoglutarate dehydrogenase E1 subunit family protein n=1 Tax=Kineococcus glutinatus TaxID=1070872 RepID=UPI0031EF0E5D